MAEKIPIFENNLTTEPIDLNFSRANISAQLQQLNAAVQKSQQEVINMSLQDSSLKYQNLAQQEILNAYEATPSDPEALRKALEDKQKILIRGVPLGLRRESQEWFNANSQGFISKARSNQVAVLDTNIRKESLDTIDYNQKQIRLYAGNIFDEDPVKANEAATGAFGAISNILGTLESTGISGRPIFTADQQFNITNETRVGLISSSINQKFNSLQSIQEKREFFDNYVNNKISIPFVGAGGEKMEIVPTAELSEGQFRALGNQLAGELRAAEQQQIKLEYDHKLQSVINGTAVPDPADAEYRKVVNDAYSSVLRGTLQELPPEQRVTLMLQFAKRNQIMPDMMKREVSAWVESGDEDQLKTAVGFISQANISYPQANLGLSDASVGKAIAINEKLEAGVPYKDAKDFGEALYSHKTKEVYENRQKEFGQLVRKKNFNFTDSAAASVKRGFLLWGKGEFPPETIIGEQAGIDYRNLVETYYVLNRDWDKAKEAADSRFAFRWGLSEANDKKVMMLPPERVYSVDELDPKWIRNQLIEEVSAIKKELNLNIDETKPVLITDDQTITELENGIPPTYVVSAKDDSGAIQPIPGPNNKPARWRPDLNRATQELNVQLRQTRDEKQARKETDPRIAAVNLFKFHAFKRGQDPDIRFIKKALGTISKILDPARDILDDFNQPPTLFPDKIPMPKRLEEEIERRKTERLLR